MYPDMKNLFLGFFGVCAGGMIASGIFAFLVIIGVFPRLISKTKTKAHILLFESMIITGGILGNFLDMYKFSLPIGPVFGMFFLIAMGAAMGIFVGSLVMSLAETSKSIPIISRRLRLSMGLQYIIIAFAVGKLIGSLSYFYFGMGGS